MNEHFFLSTVLINQILSYLSKHPYYEVFELIQSIQNQIQQQLNTDK